ncbi:sugar ABC transporter permease [Phytohabitans sp. ZYX-F-186]|uniref:Sugar ABC transporter permease n=1 Tax=Phytohabitans maris TaxID=3071409 RepID=A0ABU0ZBC8_9ACTN|nr:sugar ABC transporter permease [Phytohabitans sp. ZYX-F-186]MDQ7903635.1 sugar ABC transporter permease [Phytohabitans sp. ZYX-F-186]
MSVTAPARAPRADARRAWTGRALTAPAVLVMVALAGLPMVTVVVGGFSASGWDALRDLAGSPAFGQMLRNTAVWVVLSVVGALVIGYAAALLLAHRSVRLPGVWRSLLLIPYITPAIVSATVWKWYLSRDFGLLNEALRRLGIVDGPVDWLSNTHVVLPALAAIQVWATFPFVMLFVSAGLQAIPAERFEAARLFGAGPFAILRYVVLPALRGVTFILVLIITVWALNSFVIIWVVTRGGPAGASTILPVTIYQAFKSGNYASVYAVAVIQLAVTMLLVGLYARRSQVDEA